MKFHKKDFEIEKNCHKLQNTESQTNPTDSYNRVLFNTHVVVEIHNPMGM